MFLINLQSPCHDDSDFCFKSLGTSVTRINIFHHLSSKFVMRQTAFTLGCHWVPPPLPYFTLSHFCYFKFYERQERSLKSETLCLWNQLELMRAHEKVFPGVDGLSCHPHYHLIS